MKQYYIFYCLLLLLVACNDTPKPVNQSDTPAPVTTMDTRPTVYLEGCYATSTRSGSDVRTLFDADSNNYWETQPGAGPDEGIMLYFKNSMPLAAIQLTANGDSFDPASAQMQVYVNGTALPPAAPGQKVSLGQQPVKSLYLRFNTTGKEKAVDVVKNDVKTEVLNYPANASIRISNLQVWNDKNEEVRLIAPLQQAGKAEASTTLAPASAFSVANLFDSRKEFAWVEGNASSSGVNETLRFTFDQDVHITAIQIWNGYQRSDEHFSANARVRDFIFGQSGAAMHTYTMRDSKAGQIVELTTAAQGKVFEFQIKSIYPGRKYKDLAISDILFFDGDTPFTLKTDFAAQTSKTMKTYAGTSPLQSILDRRISNKSQDAETTKKSLIIRSDGTFVMYNLTEETGDQILADGNWEMNKGDASSATITVFGKWFSVFNMAAYYEGNSQEEETRIFKDEVVITPETVIGTKMLGEFWVK